MTPWCCGAGNEHWSLLLNEKPLPCYLHLHSDRLVFIFILPQQLLQLKAKYYQIPFLSVCYLKRVFWLKMCAHTYHLIKTAPVLFPSSVCFEHVLDQRDFVIILIRLDWSVYFYFFIQCRWRLLTNRAGKLEWVPKWVPGDPPPSKQYQEVCVYISSKWLLVKYPKRSFLYLHLSEPPSLKNRVWNEDNCYC